MKKNDKYIYVQQLKERFGFEQVTGDEKALKRKIFVPDTNRPGLELAGYFDHSQKTRILILGDEEFGYIKTMGIIEQYRSFNFLTDTETPVLIISKNRECPTELVRIANEKNFPVLVSALSTSQLILKVTTYLDEELAPMKLYHGELLAMYGKGVMLLGESGIGKSELAMELMRRGHQLVADDRVDCYQIHNRILGKAPELLQGLLEVRGIGIIDVPRMFGANAYLKQVSVNLVIELAPWDSSAEYDRVGIEALQSANIMGVKIPKITLPVRDGRSMGYVIEAAVTNMILKENGYDSAKEFEQRTLNYIDTQKKGEE